MLYDPAMALQIPLTGEEWYILRAYDVHTPLYHTQERSGRRLEEVMQDAGLYVVGTPQQGGLTQHATFAARLARNGYLERVKGEPDEPIAYRLTQLGERTVWQQDRAKLETERAAEREQNVRRVPGATRPCDRAGGAGGGAAGAAG